MKEVFSGALRSRTIWVATALAALMALQANLDSLKDLLKEHVGVFGTVIAILIAVLRVLTTAPIEDLAPPPREPPHDEGTSSDDNA